MVPFGSEVVPIVRVAGAIVRLRLTFAFRAGELESVTWKVSGVALAGAVGVPLIRPVVALSERPAGRVPKVSCQ